jgi:two-component system, chemotaxis family, protein-glutamate methylesterase/glutaminase
MQNTSIVVIGCSAGCVPALMTLVKDFDADWPAAMFVTLHIGRRRSLLPQLLGEQCPMPVSHATEGMPIGRGHVYIAPPDRHLHVYENDMRLGTGPRINWTRPAVDPMFSSAAAAHGAAVIAVIMSGTQRDGVAGLSEVEGRGGQTIVQHPDDAEWPDLPRNALGAVQANHVVPLRTLSFTIAMCLSQRASLAKRVAHA